MDTAPLPVVLVAAADAGARAAVVRELERRYTADYRIVAVSSHDDVMQALADVAAGGGVIALVLADDRTATGVAGTVFAAARRLFPDARRGLLIEWGSWGDRATRDRVLELMASGQIEYYVIRPWHSPDEYFHRTVTEFLLEWERSIGVRPREVTVIGDQALVRTHELRSLLARGGVPHTWLAPGSEEAVARLAALGEPPDPRHPIVVLLDGRVLRNPGNAELAEAYGLDTALDGGRVADLVVVGAGPAGLAAAVYAASEGLDVLVVEREAIGGQAGSSSLIRNYLGFSRGISGSELAQRAYQQAWVFGARFAHSREAIGLRAEGDGFVVRIAPDDEVSCRSVVLATGVSYRRIEVPELEALEGAGVFYGASAVEAQAMAGKVVHVVGGGNSAGQAALHLARYAASVTLLVRGATLAASMSQYLIDQLHAQGVTVRSGAEVVGGGGDGVLERILVRDRTTDVTAEEPCDGLFVLIGASPRTDWLPPEVLRDRWGYVLTGPLVLEEGGRRAWTLERDPDPHETSLPGVFAVGDVRRASVKRVASAVGEGSVVVSAVHAHLAAQERIAQERSAREQSGQERSAAG